jgi:hypothetical protein
VHTVHALQVELTCDVAVGAAVCALPASQRASASARTFAIPEIPRWR